MTEGVFTIYDILTLLLSSHDKQIRGNYFALSSFFRKRIKKMGLSSRDVMTWFNYKRGFNQKQLGQVFSVTQQAISQRIKKVKSAVPPDGDNLIIPDLSKMKKFRDKQTSDDDIRIWF